MYVQPCTTKGHSNYCGLIHGPHLEKYNKWYTLTAQIIMSLYVVYVIYKYGRWPHNTTWSAAGWETHAVDKGLGSSICFCVRVENDRMSWRKSYGEEEIVLCFTLLPQHSTGGADESSVKIIGDTPEMQSRHLSNMHVTQKHWTLLQTCPWRLIVSHECVATC